jgi:iron complex outermembrane receptor protein
MKLSLAAKGWLFVGCAAGALSLSGTALAQDDGTSIQEIVVTAQRRAERLEDVPMSVTAISAEAVESRGIRNLQDLGQITAGVQIGFQGSFTYPAIRGVSSATTGVGFENNVAVYIDGYYQPDVNSINQDFANIESIQVLKGPQGALYGRNATGGAMLITTAQPSETLTGKLEAKYGNYDDKTLSGYISGPITDRLRYSLSAYGRKTDGYYDLLNAQGQKIGNATPIHNYSARAKLQADVTDDFKVTLAYNFNELMDGRGSMFGIESGRGSLTALLPPAQGRLYQPRTFAGIGTRQLTITNEGTLTMAWTTPIGTLTSYTGYAYRRITGNFDFDGFPVQISTSGTRYIEDTFQQGLDYVVTAVDKLDLVVGANYYEDRTKTRWSDGYAGNRRSTRQGTTYLTKAWAIYADGSYHLTDRLTLSAGARYTEEKRKTRFFALTFATVPGGAYSVPPIADPQRTFTNFSPRVSVRYEVADNTNVYASVSRGFRSGFIQQVPNPPTTFVNVIQPEKITAYEIGFKTAQRRFRFDAAAFYYDDKDFHIGLTVPNPANPSIPFNITSNAKKAEIYGVEAQAEFEIIENLNVSVGAAYLHARFKDFKNATNVGLNAATGLNVTQPNIDWSGQQMNRAPDFSATLGVSYKMEDVLGGELVASTNVKYTDSYVPNNPSIYGPLAGAALANKQRFREGSYTLVNAALNWTDPSEHYEVGVWVNNLFDKDYHLSVNGNALTGNYGTWAWPRQYGARVGYKF